MKTVIQTISILIMAGSSFFSAYSQSPDKLTVTVLTLENGVAVHKGLDNVYTSFAEGYRKLDADMVAGLYAENAAYLPPGSNVLIGREKIAKNFADFFSSVKQNNGRLEISFRIVQRQVDKNLAYDIGIYTLTSFNEKGESSKGTGKFVVVGKREKNGIWRFQVDAYNDLAAER